MKRDELLTLAAMCTPGWGEIPAACPDALLIAEWHWEAGVKTLRGSGHVIHEPEYHRRRAELINEPDDADAPEWAKWKAQDADGAWVWFDAAPENDNSPEWLHGDLGVQCELAAQGSIPTGHDWRETRRPVNQQARSPHWDGKTWPPPVGAKVMSSFSRSSGVEVEVLALRHGNVIGCCTESGVAGWVLKEHASPIRTDEDKAVDSIFQFSGVRSRDGGHEIAKEIYRAIAAGEIPGVKLEGE